MIVKSDFLTGNSSKRLINFAGVVKKFHNLHITGILGIWQAQRRRLEGEISRFDIVSIFFIEKIDVVGG